MNTAAIIYSTKSGTTEAMALAVQAGLKEAGVEVVVKNVEKGKINDLARADAIVLGCPTYYKDLLPSMKSFLFEMKKINLKGKIGAAFGPYAWSGESIQMMTDTMKHVFHMNVIEPGLKLLQRPEKSDMEASVEFGRTIARKIQEIKSGSESKVNIN